MPDAETTTGAHSLAEELRLLIELVAERAAPWLDGVVAAGHSESALGHHDEPSGGCGWCPLCAVVALARGERPEIVARVLEQAAQLVALLRAVLADRWAPEEGVHMPGFTPSRQEPRGEHGATRVQHVPVRRREDWDTGR